MTQGEQTTYYVAGDRVRYIGGAWRIGRTALCGGDEGIVTTGNLDPDDDVLAHFRCGDDEADVAVSPQDLVWLSGN